jgi:succinoglycan biosynthesis protein ExoA
MSTPPLVTVLVPARNEEADIEACLAAILAQDHPADRLEVLVVDGGSTDDTADLASAVLERASYVRWKVLDNVVGTTPSNLNYGLAVAQGEYLCRVDARSIVPTHYVRTCAEVLAARPDVAVVGGAQVAVPADRGHRSVGIARALNNRWGMGGARYRRGAASGPTDTVYLGAFRTTELRGARGWDQTLHTNQDYELNRRMGRQGLVWFDDRLQVGYVPRPDVRSLFRQYHRFGRWKATYWQRTNDRPRPRQLVMLAAPAVGAAAVAVGLGRPSTRVATAAVLAVGAAVFEATGSSTPTPGTAAARAVSVGASAAAAAGWWTGVVRGVLGSSTS